MVAGGGALGSVLRFWLSNLIGRRFGDAFPWGTLLVNVTGCLAIGLFAGWRIVDSRFFANPEWRFALMAGLCGGYTTFSAFSLETLNLGLAGEWPRALLNILASLVCCLLAVAIGYFAATGLTR